MGMIKNSILGIFALALSGCYEPTPTKDQAMAIANEEVSMAICGNREVHCIFVDGGTVHIGERRTDNTIPITVSVKNIKTKAMTDGVLTSGQAPVDAGMVVYDFDSKSGKTQVKEISLWSEDGKHSIELCGHDYKFCRK